MRLRTHIGWTVLFCQFLLSVQTDAQYVFEQAYLLDNEKGLVSNEIRATCKSPDGFVWIGTADGLCRYDGTHVKIYRNDPNDTTSLADNQVYDVKPFNNKIWVATNMGLSVLDPHTQTFTNYQFGPEGATISRNRIPKQEVKALFADPYGDLWIGTHSYGVFYYRPTQNEFKRFVIQSWATLPANTRGAISFAASTVNDSIIYAGTASGLQEINRITGKMAWYVFPQATGDLTTAANAFRRIYCHDDGLLYAGSWEAGVHVFDPKQKTYIPLPLKEGPGNFIVKSGIRGLLRKSSNEIWITTGAGLGIYDTLLKEFTFWKANNLKERKYYGIDFIDERNRAWFGTINGVYVFDPCIQQFSVFDFGNLRPPGWSFVFYQAMGRSDDELIVLPRYDDGIYHFNLLTHDWQRYPLKVPGLKTPEFWSTRGLVRAPDGTFTISSDHGLFSYAPATHRLSVLPYHPPLQYNRYGDILWDKKGQLWLCAREEGVARWDPRTQKTKVFRLELEPETTASPVSAVRSPYEDSRQHIWFIREGGFSVFIPERDTMINFIYERNPAVSFDVVNSIAEDGYGRMWMSDNDSWIGYAEVDHPELGIVKKINLRALYGLEQVYELARGPKGNIWGYTSKYLLRLDVSTMQVSTFSFEYGGNPVDFYSFQFAADGRLVLGGRNKIVLFDPDVMQPNTERPEAYIEEVRLQGKTLPAIPETDGQPELRFRHWENFFSIAFSAKAYTLGEKCRFRYRLKGFDDWTEANNRRDANYTNVPGGDYVFQVQVANNEGVWNDRILNLPVWIQTAWWASWWFRLAVSLILLTLGYAAYRYRIVQIRRQERLRTEFEKQLANVEMSALLAQMNPHFLFNCLNSIDSYIIRNESAKASEYLNNFARLMRLILNNSRSNYINLKDELESLDLYLQMENLRFKDKFTYEIKVGDQIDTSLITIPPMLIQPHVENAVWHGLMPRDGDGGKVTIEIAKRGDDLVCNIEDNGIGRVRAMELSSGPRGSHRKSMGMQITEDRIEIINKLYGSNMQVQIRDLYDDEGSPAGTQVTLTIPL